MEMGHPGETASSAGTLPCTPADTPLHTHMVPLGKAGQRAELGAETPGQSHPLPLTPLAPRSAQHRVHSAGRLASWL